MYLFTSNVSTVHRNATNWGTSLILTRPKITVNDNVLVLYFNDVISY